MTMSKNCQIRKVILPPHKTSDKHCFGVLVWILSLPGSALGFPDFPKPDKPDFQYGKIERISADASFYL